MPRTSQRTSTRPGNLLMMYVGTAGLLAIIAICAGVTMGAQFAVPIVVLAALVLGFFALNHVWARRVLDRHHGDPLAVQNDETESLPTGHVIPDETALGDTAEAHAEISPHDVPKGSPGRRAVERQAARQQRDTTRGNEHGAAGGRVLDHADAPPSRDEGYEDERPACAPRAR